MDRTSFLAVFLLLFIVSDVANASMLTKHRFLIGDPPKGNSDNPTLPGKDSPVASPPPPSKPDPDPNPKPVDDGKNKTGSAPPAKTPKTPDPNPEPKGSNNSTQPAPVGPPTDTGGGKNNQTQKQDPNPEQKPKEKPTPEPEKKPKENPTPEPEQKPKENPTPEPEQKPKENPTPEPEQKPKENPTPEPGKTPEEDPSAKTPEIEKTKNKSDNVTNTPNVKKESCDGVIKTCSTTDMIACIKSFNRESTEAVILVQNVRDSALNGSLSAEDTRDLVILKHEYKKIKLNMGKSNKIVLKGGNGECVLQMDPFVSEGNLFMRFPSYEKLVTPINGAYFLIVTVLIFGGMWVCCLVRRRKQRTGGGVPYQELEMALPESASATDVVTAEGWDQGWDDDWDGDNAVKSPGGHLVGSISANGLTARSLNKDGWENNWDD
ncbi:uncharacterized protein LOC133721286 isoform X1 [Rosa rugosa]|uniref:uncharacterized protein LOC133721286 isoform X1 n=1 Tax=Rosa rugosa TaxID=74645 RepID=UPI002B407D87|nr:uncharacterized protein LOC133721286 isoform X1 [Rosa rugosa]